MPSFNLRKNEEKRSVESYDLQYGASIHIFDTSIPMSVRAAETPAIGVSIYKHDAKGKVALAYEELTQEVANNG